MSGNAQSGRWKKEDNFCRVAGCERKVKARGLCSTHYGRWWVSGSVQEDKPVRHWGGYPGDESASIEKG